MPTFFVAEGDARDDSRAIANAELTFEDSTLASTELLIAEGDPDDNGIAEVDGRVTFIDSTADISQRVRLGFWDDGAAVGNSITARLNLISSALDTPLLEIGVVNPVGHPLDAEVALNPSYIRTDLLQLGPTSRIVLTVEGPIRANRNNLGQPGLYAAIDAGGAQLEGEVIVVIDYPALRGASFDVLRTGPGGLTGSTANFRFVGAPEDAGTLEVISDNGEEVLRLTVNRNLGDPGVGPATATPIPVDHPLVLAALIALMGLLVRGGLLRRGSNRAR